MSKIFFISLVCYFVLILVQAQENVGKTILENKALLENEVGLEDKLIFKDNSNLENNIISKNETISENIGIIESGTISKNLTILEINTDPKNVTTESKNITTDSKIITTDSKNVTTDSNILTTDSKILTIDSNNVTIDSLNITISKNDEVFDSKDASKNKELTNNVNSLVGRIVNGTEAYLGQFPQQVSLRRTGSKQHFCGGSIVGLKYIVTAAHCMFVGDHMEIAIPPTSITIVAGDVLLQGTSITTQERIVQKIIKHRYFNKDTLEHDIALLQLEKPLVENDAIQVAKLPTARSIPGTLCEVSGWGDPSEGNHVVSNTLMFVRLPLINRTLCRELLVNSSTVPNGMICAGYIQGERDACQGDSGGGMVCKNRLTGIVSGGEGCARPRKPGIYTDVYFYRKWINSAIFNSELSTNFRSNSSNTIFINIFWLVASLISALLLSMYC
ncbi:trypsin-1-like [Leptopilina heterotoma]|uniref:trypsin-1-like n=1 Tax=Leptopilina heterotoma TaxID=63436 RepID=UPI001CA81EF4|nr:trypsin-1-like [Leptopilina heterotoma]